MREHLAANLRRLMQEQSLGPTELAELAKVGRSTVHRWLAGEGIRQKQIDQLAKIFNTDPDVIIYGKNIINEDKLATIIEIVERYLADKEIMVEPEKKAQIIVYLYKYGSIENIEITAYDTLDLLVT
ncbi:MAG: helix-turn-helix domain-containing protein [Candidatus Thiodiazotropha weberae]|uniref:HTH cro/C1-type domain-containing protein n=1 Tax=Candidatus Thiodiazotropha endoloripes TaxID=1818881 RepID=A0A1E2UNU7_9GAMM|nr:helix-turn-helix transcriptional regulator [Candidatus Thiodiazotropha endoloripes]MCG7898951.1 helix-turn-helix domain-containing protein [Candidatus Thiodiazotropha weberae]ODB96403.1 hypothetical protein A3196_06310 [Candidatus Thiodiazotropha endoloripes]